MPSARNFIFRPALTFAAAVSFAILIGLGSWQLQRLEWKRALIATVDARMTEAPASLSAYLPMTDDADIDYAPVQVSGRVAETPPIRIFGTLDAVAGYYVFTLLVLSNGDAAFVNLGFVDQRDWSDAMAAEIAALGEATFTGLLRRPAPASGLAALFAPAPDIDGRLWFHRDIAAMRAAYGVGDPAYYIDAQPQPGADWPKPGATRVEFSNRHLEYALTWFGLAATLVGVWLAASFERRR